jgi:hypothetical protein
MNIIIRSENESFGMKMQMKELQLLLNDSITKTTNYTYSIEDKLANITVKLLDYDYSFVNVTTATSNNINIMNETLNNIIDQFLLRFIVIEANQSALSNTYYDVSRQILLNITSIYDNITSLENMIIVSNHNKSEELEMIINNQSIQNEEFKHDLSKLYVLHNETSQIILQNHDNLTSITSHDRIIVQASVSKIESSINSIQLNLQSYHDNQTVLASKYDAISSEQDSIHSQVMVIMNEKIPAMQASQKDENDNIKNSMMNYQADYSSKLSEFNASSTANYNLLNNSLSYLSGSFAVLAGQLDIMHNQSFAFAADYNLRHDELMNRFHSNEGQVKSDVAVLFDRSNRSIVELDDMKQDAKVANSL